MRIRIIAFIILSTLVLSCQKKGNRNSNQPDAPKMFNSIDFLAIDLKSPDSTFTVVIQSSDLFEILSGDKTNKSVDDYEKTIKDYLETKKPIQIKSSLVPTFKDFTIRKDSSFQTLSGMPKEMIIGKYFKDRILKNEKIPFPIEKQVIFCLIQQGVRCWRQDYSGVIMIERI